MKYLLLILFSLSVFADVPNAAVVREKAAAIKKTQLSKESIEANDLVDRAIIWRSDRGFFDAKVTVNNSCDEAISFGIGTRLEAKGYKVSFSGNYVASCAVEVSW